MSLNQIEHTHLSMSTTLVILILRSCLTSRTPNYNYHLNMKWSSVTPNDNVISQCLRVINKLQYHRHSEGHYVSVLIVIKSQSGSEWNIKGCAMTWPHPEAENMLNASTKYISKREWSPNIQLVFVSGHIEVYNGPIANHNPQPEPTPLLTGSFLVGGAY